MREKVLEVEKMLSNPHDHSFLTACKIGSKNCAAYKNYAKINDVYLKKLIRTKKHGVNHHLDYGFFKGCLIPGKIKIQGSKPFSVNNFSHIPYPKPGFAQLLGFTMFNGCGKNNSRLGYSGVVTRMVRKGLTFNKSELW